MADTELQNPVITEEDETQPDSPKPSETPVETETPIADSGHNETAKETNTQEQGQVPADGHDEEPAGELTSPDPTVNPDSGEEQTETKELIEDTVQEGHAEGDEPVPDQPQDENDQELTEVSPTPNEESGDDTKEPSDETGEEKTEANEEAQEVEDKEALGEVPQDAEHDEEGAQQEAAGSEAGDRTPQEDAGDDISQTAAPQNDSVIGEDHPESPIDVGEKLSREATPADMEDEEGHAMSPSVPRTPDQDGTMTDDEEEEYEVELDEEAPQFDRDQLIERYQQALSERQQLQEQNYQLQHKLADYFRKKKSEETQRDVDKNVTDQEQRYLKYMANLEELRRQDTEERELFKMQIEELKDRCQDRQGRVDDERLKFMDFQRQVAVNSVNSRSGKNITPKDIDQYMGSINRKEGEVVNVRLENIKLKNKLKKKENQLKSKEELAEGLHLIDFEQLKIENQTYNEKIEERNEELLKLRKKITSTVQVLTHLKEKLQFVQAENQVQRVKLREVEELAARKRDILSRTKQARDGLRIDNQKLRQNCGLLGNEPLLRDFEERKDEGDDLKDKLDGLKMEHAELTLNLNGVRRKIEQARSGRP